MRKSLALILILPLLLMGCATGRTVLVQAICPRLPDLEQLPAAQVPSFTDRMQLFLQGSLEKPTAYELTSGSAKLPTIPPAKP